MKSKKLLLGSLSAMALVATPIAAVVSCGKKDEQGDNKDAAKAATKFVASDLIKKIAKGDKGFVATLAMGPKSIKFYVSEADAKTETKINFMKSEFVLPALKTGVTGLKAKVTLSDDMIAAQKTAVKSGGLTGDKLAKALAAAGQKEKEIDIALTAASTITDKLVVNKHLVENDKTTAASTLETLLTTVGGEGSIYKFDFKPESLKVVAPATVAKPELTKDATKAFEEIFKKAGLSVKITFAITTAKNVDTIVPTLTLTKYVAPSTEKDAKAITDIIAVLDDAKDAGALSTTASPVSVKPKGTHMTAAQFLTELNKTIKGTGSGVANGTLKGMMLTDEMFKDDMAITIEITTDVTSSKSGIATLKITTGDKKTRSTTITIQFAH